MSKIRKKFVAKGLALAAVGVTVVALLVLASLLYIKISRLPSNVNRIRELSLEANLPQINLDKVVCHDEGCLSTSFNFLKFMNGTVNPCDDFYQFACGRKDVNSSESATEISVWEALICEVASVSAKILKEKEEEDELIHLTHIKEIFRQCVEVLGNAVDKGELERSFGRFYRPRPWCTKVNFTHAELLCGEMISKTDFAWAISTRYLEEIEFEEQLKGEAMSMVDSVKEAFGELVNEASWIGNATKASILKKKNAMGSVIGYPDWIRNRIKVNEYFEGIEVASWNSSFILKNFEVIKKFGGLAESTENEGWGFSPIRWTPWYRDTVNKIGIPAAILRKPFIGSTLPKFQTFSTLGLILGHEIVHGFDTKRIKYDSKLNFVDLWTDLARKEWEKRILCIANQYNKHCYNFTTGDTQCINGTSTQNENIADNGGLRTSFRAYQKFVTRNGAELTLPGLEAYTTEQLFFIGYASSSCESDTEDDLKYTLLKDSHTPAKWRVNGILKNSVEFARAFNCPINSNGMNVPLEEKCVVW